MQEIIPGLFLGPYSAVMKSKIDQLLAAGISHIVCVRQDIEAHLIRPNFPDKFKYIVLDIADTVTTNIIQFLPKVKRFIDDCLANNGKVLVHGNAGISRSAALVIGYVMESHGLSYKDTFALVQQRRFCINPNEGFAQQLKEYEPIYQAKHTLQNGQTSKVTGNLKRRIEEVEESEGGGSNMDITVETNPHLL